MTQPRLWLLILPLFAALPRAFGQNALLSYIAAPAGTQLSCKATDSAGDLFLVFSTAEDAITDDYSVSIVKLDPSFHSTATSSLAVPFAPVTAAVDQNGNLWLAGSNTLMRLASSSSPALSVSIDGTTGNGHTSTSALAMTVDSSGNVYVTGTTLQRDFALTPGAFQGFPAIGPEPPLIEALGFVCKFSSNGARLSATLIWGVQIACPPSGACGYAVTTAPAAIAWDASGNVTIAGSTNAVDYPVTPHAPQTACQCSGGAESVFITRLNPDFSALVWSTFLGGFATVSGIAVEPDDGVVVAGVTYEADFPTTSGAIEPVSSAPRLSAQGFVTRLNASGTAWVFSTYLSGSNNAFIYGIQTDSTGDVWVAGSAPSSNFPVPAGTLQLGSDMALELVSDGSHAQVAEYLPEGTAGGGLVMNADGSLTAIGLQYSFAAGGTPTQTSASTLRLPAGQAQGISILGVADSAAYQTAGTVAPGEFLSLYGTGLGPAEGIGASLDSNSRFGSELGGVSVLFDGQAAPLLWVSANQINMLVPYEIANSAQTTLQVTTSGGPSQTLALTVVPAQPNIFVVVNADGSVNGPGHPAVAGSILTAYASGAGVLTQSLPDGSLTGNPAPAPAAEVSMNLPDSCPPGQALRVLYAGGSPGLVVSALQVNFQWQPPTSIGFPTVICSALPYVQLGVGTGLAPPYLIY